MSKIKLSTICVDDEYPALELIKNYCQKTDELNLVSSFNKSNDALLYLQNNTVDLIILDIKMPIISGIELLNKIPKGQLCIFITADSNHAAQAYEMDVIDYLIKPVSFERFHKAIQKASDYYKFIQTQSTTHDFLLFKSDYMIHKVKIEDIKWIEGSGEYIKIVSRFKQYLVLQRMTTFEEQYKNHGWIRIHKSYLIHVKSIASYNSQTVVLKNGTSLPIGRSYKNNLE